MLDLTPLVVGLVLAAGCAAKQPPLLEPLLDRESRTAVVLIPGTTGSRLVEVETGRIVWGRAGNLVRPGDHGHGIALPLTEDDSYELQPAGPIEAMRWGPFRVEIYGPLIRALVANGYGYGDLDDPQAEDDLFVFDYDWRLGNVDAARSLVGKLERLRRARGDATLDVHLVCHSNASRIARWLVKYSDATLEEAEAGKRGPPPGIRVDQVILIAPDNGGALAALAQLDRGRKYVPWIGRRFAPETLFTFPALFEALPVLHDDLFFDEDGVLLDVDLVDPESWRRYGLSIYDEDARRRIRRSDDRDRFGDPTEWDHHLQRLLDRARRFHELLMQDVETFPTVRFRLIQNRERPTRERALLLEKEGEFRLLFADDRRVRRDDDLHALASSPGDGHATLANQLALSPQERAAIVEPTLWLEEPHRRMVRSPEVQVRILHYLLD